VPNDTLYVLALTLAFATAAAALVFALRLVAEREHKRALYEAEHGDDA
jgi:hypothetical protein